MLAQDFENALKPQGFYFESPSFFIPSANTDAEGYSAEQLLDILAHENDFRPMVRKRSEQMNTLTYYFKDEAATEYFKVVCPTSIGITENGGINMPEWKEIALNVLGYGASGFLLGFAGAFVVQPSIAIPDLKLALYGASVMGLYQAVVEVAKYLKTIVLPKATNAGKPVKSFTDRML